VFAVYDPTEEGDFAGYACFRVPESSPPHPVRPDAYNVNEPFRFRYLCNGFDANLDHFFLAFLPAEVDYTDPLFSLLKFPDNPRRVPIVSSGTGFKLRDDVVQTWTELEVQLSNVLVLLRQVVGTELTTLDHKPIPMPERTGYRGVAATREICYGQVLGARELFLCLIAALESCTVRMKLLFKRDWQTYLLDQPSKFVRPSFVDLLSHSILVKPYVRRINVWVTFSDLERETPYSRAERILLRTNIPIYVRVPKKKFRTYVNTKINKASIYGIKAEWNELLIPQPRYLENAEKKAKQLRYSQTPVPEPEPEPEPAPAKPPPPHPIPGSRQTRGEDLRTFMARMKDTDSAWLLTATSEEKKLKAERELKYCQHPRPISGPDSPAYFRWSEDEYGYALRIPISVSNARKKYWNDNTDHSDKHYNGRTHEVDIHYDMDTIHGEDVVPQEVQLELGVHVIYPQAIPWKKPHEDQMAEAEEFGPLAHKLFLLEGTLGPPDLDFILRFFYGYKPKTI